MKYSVYAVMFHLGSLWYRKVIDYDLRSVAKAECYNRNANNKNKAISFEVREWDSRIENEANATLSVWPA